MKRIFTLMAMVTCIVMDLHAQLNPPIWSKNYGGQIYDYTENIVLRGNIIAISGSTSSNTGDFEGMQPGQADMFWITTDLDGNIQRKKLYGGSRVEQCHAMIRTADGGFLLVGGTDSWDGDVTGYHTHTAGDVYRPDFWVVKINGSGVIQWTRAFGGTGAEEAWGVTQTDDDGDGRKDDGYAIVGYTTSNDGDVAGYHNGQDAWVIKLTASGDLEWQRALGGTRSEWGRKIEQMPDGGYLLISETYSSNGDVVGYHPSPSFAADWWIVKLSASGSIVWSRTYGGSGSEVPFEMSLTDDDGDGRQDDGFVITGHTDSRDGDVPLPFRGVYDMLLVKFDLSGNVQWHQRVGGTGQERGNDVVQTIDGGYAVYGTTGSANGDLSGTQPRGLTDNMLIKFTADGNREFIQRFGGSGAEEAQSIQQLPDGCYILAGNSKSTDGDVPGNYGDQYDVWVMNWCAPIQLPVTLTDFNARYEGDGKTVLDWTTAAEQNNDKFEIQRSVDGQNFYTIGTVNGAGTTSHTVRYTYTDQGVDALGADVVYYRLRQVDIDGKDELSTVVMVRPKLKNGAQVRVWPNPSDGRFQVQLKKLPTDPVKAIIYNANGQVVMSTTFLKATNEIDLSGKNAGTYFIRLEDKNGFSHIEPVIVK